jgi:hypothetical protein
MIEAAILDASGRPIHPVTPARQTRSGEASLLFFFFMRSPEIVRRYRTRNKRKHFTPA